jgi:hypothetical protein
VIGHDGAGIAAIFLCGDDLFEGTRNDGDRLVWKREQLMAKMAARYVVELTQLRRFRLKLFATVMQFAQVREPLDADLVRTAAPRIVRQPPAVGGPDEVVPDDDDVLAKRKRVSVSA